VTPRHPSASDWTDDVTRHATHRRSGRLAAPRRDYARRVGTARLQVAQLDRPDCADAVIAFVACTHPVLASTASRPGRAKWFTIRRAGATPEQERAAARLAPGGRPVGQPHEQAWVAHASRNRRRSCGDDEGFARPWSSASLGLDHPPPTRSTTRSHPFHAAALGRPASLAPRCSAAVHPTARPSGGLGGRAAGCEVEPRRAGGSGAGGPDFGDRAELLHHPERVPDVVRGLVEL
jgi:hypothetical protein